MAREFRYKDRDGCELLVWSGLAGAVLQATGPEGDQVLVAVRFAAVAELIAALQQQLLDEELLSEAVR